MGLQERFEELRARIERAAERSRRPASAITLVAVTKTVGIEEIRAAHGLGLRDFGENRVQDLIAKRPALADLEIRWHMIGHLQTNKVRPLLPEVHLIHSIDSIRLAEKIHEQVPEGERCDLLLQANTSGEASKFGVAPDEAPALARQIVALPRLRLRGVMTLGPWMGGEREVRRSFRQARALGESLSEIEPEASLLSMGMSGDFEVAIEEGATHLRLGTLLFGERGRPHPS